MPPVSPRAFALKFALRQKLPDSYCIPPHGALQIRMQFSPPVWWHPLPAAHISTAVVEKKNPTQNGVCPMTDIPPRCPFCANVLKIEASLWTRLGFKPGKER